MNTFRFGLRPFFPATLSDFFEQPQTNTNTIFKPETNILEDEKQYSIEISLAGFSKDEIEINHEDKELKVSATRSQKEESEKKYSWNEFAYKTKFERAFQIPDSVNLEGIKANFENGILTVSLPKKEIQELTAVKIEIN